MNNIAWYNHKAECNSILVFNIINYDNTTHIGIRCLYACLYSCFVCNVCLFVFICLARSAKLPEGLYILARSANLPEGLYILPMFFLYFFLFFFNGRLSSHRS